MNKDYDLKNRIRVQVNQFDLIMVEKTVEELASGEAESTMEEGQHYNLVGVGSGNIFILSWPPLENDMGGEKIILVKLEECTLICC
jgi:hypothetical protein